MLKVKAAALPVLQDWRQRAERVVLPYYSQAVATARLYAAKAKLAAAKYARTGERRRGSGM